jgi:hypothetical protein
MNFLLSLATTMHLGFEGEYNSIHPHTRFESNDYAIGAYLNSENNISPYVSYSLKMQSYSLELGLVGGYSIPAVPLLRLGKSLSKDVDIFITPGFENNTENPKIVLGLEFTLR